MEKNNIKKVVMVKPYSNTNTDWICVKIVFNKKQYSKRIRTPYKKLNFWFYEIYADSFHLYCADIHDGDIHDDVAKFYPKPFYNHIIELEDFLGCSIEEYLFGNIID